MAVADHMDWSDDLSEGRTSSEPTTHARAYQLEMFELAMQSNIIVTDLEKPTCEIATSTSSPTEAYFSWQIYMLTQRSSAKLRIEAELERNPSRRVWYLAPSVALADQQHHYLSTQLAYHNFRLITGLDNVQFWSTQDVWNSALEGINVVVSTPQVLLDALSHAFISLYDLSLLVFDEAHHCIAKAPMANVMRLFYHPARTQTMPCKLPHILGLTASPITNKASTLKELETNLNAICKSPTVHIEELEQYVHVPRLDKITYDVADHIRSERVAVLDTIVKRLKIEDEPEFKRLTEKDSPASMAKLEKIYRRGYTKIMQQCRSFLGNAEDIEISMGSWAARLYIDTCITKLQAAVKVRESVLVDVPEEDLRYMNEKMQFITECDKFAVPSVPSAAEVAHKVQAVIDYLVKYYRPDSSAIIFVKRRSTAFVLSQLMLAYPVTAKLGVFAFVGNTKQSSRGLGDLADTQIQDEAFADFKAGRRSICIATSVMEEGIDVQATNLVVRFDEPDTFRAFVQSRGRARQSDSRIAMMQAVGESSMKLSQWAELEDNMKSQCLAVERALAVESANEDEDGLDGEHYRVSNTGAVLTYDNARSHLEHFCNTLHHAENTQSPEPIIMITGVKGKAMSAQIRLPSSVAPALQVANSLRTWRSEKAAIKDAAFQCYRRLHVAGLVSDNLLPFRPQKTAHEEAQARNSMYNVSGAVNPWLRIDQHNMHAHRVEVSNQHRAFPPLSLVLSNRLDHILCFALRSTPFGDLEVKVSPVSDECRVDRTMALRATATLFSLILGRRLKGMDMTSVENLPYLLVPDATPSNLQTWIGKVTTPPDLLSTRVFSDSLQNQYYLLRYQKEEILYLWSPSFDTGHVRQYQNDETICAQRLTKQLHFLNAALPMQQADLRTLSVEDCYVEPLPAAYGELMLLVPSVSFMIELALRGQSAIQQGPLRSIEFTNSKMASMALTAGSASSTFNYDRLEFLGDALLKFYASVQVFSDFPLLPEGALTVKRRDLVSNTRLQEATRDLGLSAYLTTDPFAGQAWKLDVTTTEHKQRDVSSKTLADIVEALLGAAFLDKRHTYGQQDLVVSALSLFLPETKWRAPSEQISKFRDAKTMTMVNSTSTSLVEGMLQYKFNNRLLLAEALTRSSIREGVSSYERLEFLGDAILDYIVGVALYDSHASDSAEMTFYRHALVNHHLLAFLGLGIERTVGIKQIVTTSRGSSTMTNTSRPVRLVDHVAAMPDKAQSDQRERAETTYLAVRGEVCRILAAENAMPWTLIRGIDTSKLYSDVVESILGAVFIDSGGSITACERMLKTFGFMQILERVTTDKAYESKFSVHKLLHSYHHIRIEHKASGQISKGTKRWTYTMSLGADIISTYTSNVSAPHAENMAADLALEFLAARKSNEELSEDGGALLCV